MRQNKLLLYLLLFPVFIYSQGELIVGSGTLSFHPDSMYFNFEQGVNGGDTLGMDIMLVGNEGTNFGSEASYYYDYELGQWASFPAFTNPSRLYYLSPGGMTLQDVTSVPAMTENWITVSYAWPNGTAGLPISEGGIWVVYCRTTDAYAVMEITYVFNDWVNPRFSFNYYYQPNGTTDFGGGTSEVFGCTDPAASNYNPDATVDDGTCVYEQADCNGDIGGSAFLDECDQCVGGNTGLQPGYSLDCNGDCFGTAYLDECGSCVAGNTGLEYGYEMDCAGVCFGNAFPDCAGECNGTAVIDDCGECTGGTTGLMMNYAMDCNGDCFGDAIIDQCGFCAGGNTGLTPDADLDCAGVCFGDSYKDPCGVCDNDPTNDCDPQDTIIFGSGTINAQPDSIYFNFEFGINSGDTTGMDIQITGNEGPGFGSEWFYAQSFSDPSMLHLMSQPGTLNDVNTVPYVYDPTVPWVTVSWEATGYQPVSVGQLWVVYTRTGGNYAVLEITDVSTNWATPYISFVYKIQLNGSNNLFSPQEIMGCTDPNASNYNPDATIDDGSCVYSQTDCNGDMNGTAYLDECGECVGGNTGLLPGYSLDCNGDCFGNAYFDECGACVSGNTGFQPGYSIDCNGDCFGEAYIDECGSCVGGNTGLLPGEACGGPQIVSIIDVPNDQGGRVYLTFLSVPADQGDGNRTTEGYSVERFDVMINSWVTVASGYAYGSPSYVYEVPTLEDSTAASNAIEEFRVIAGMDEGTWISATAFGYSVDNLAPVIPTGLTLYFTQETVELNWNSPVDSDFQYFTLYRNGESVGYSTVNSFSDSLIPFGSELNYHVTATDVHGNESGPSASINIVTGVQGDVSGDNVINVSDIVMLVDIIFGAEVSEYQLWAADVNGDGSVDVVDIVEIVNEILGGLTRSDRELMTAPVITVGDGKVKIDAYSSIAGIQLTIGGNYEILKTNLPAGWQFFRDRNVFLLFSLDGSKLTGETIMDFTGQMAIESTVISDWNLQKWTADVTVQGDSPSLSSAYPNPFNPVTQFTLNMQEDDQVKVAVYDMMGREVAVLVNGWKPAGSYTLTWEATNQPSGVYFIRMETSQFSERMKVSLTK